MTLEEELKQEILSKYRSVRAFTTAIDIPYSTLDSVFKRGISNAGVETMVKVFTALGLDLESIQDGHLRPSDIKKAPSLPDEALKVAHDYNGLDTHGKSMTRLVITEEQKRMEEELKLRTQEEVAAELTPAPVTLFSPKKKTTRKGIVMIEVFEEPSAAGTGNYVSSAPASHMEQYPEERIHSQTDFGVIVSGHSMEPKYPDKAVVFVKSTQFVEPGEVGIFLLDGQTYIKQLQVEPRSGKVTLHSLNPEFADIEVPPHADFRVQGKVLGGYDTVRHRQIWRS